MSNDTVVKLIHQKSLQSKDGTLLDSGVTQLLELFDDSVAMRRWRWPIYIGRDPAERNVLARSNFLVPKRPTFTRVIDKYRPQQVEFRSIVE